MSFIAYVLIGLGQLTLWSGRLRDTLSTRAALHQGALESGLLPWKSNVFAIPMTLVSMAFLLNPDLLAITLIATFLSAFYGLKSHLAANSNWRLAARLHRDRVLARDQAITALKEL